MKDKARNLLIIATILWVYMFGFTTAMMLQEIDAVSIYEADKVWIKDTNFYKNGTWASGKNGTTTPANGFYRHTKYFCVITANKTATEIAETTFHELAHYYQYTQPKHFNRTGGENHVNRDG